MPEPMNRPAVTVVVPTYNRAPSLARLLDGLADCDVPPGGIELIVVDDGSTDGTADVVRRSKVGARYVRQANRGPAAARNAGWRLARGPLVAFTDDDTVPDRRWLVDLVDELHARPELAALGGAIRPLRRGLLADFVQLERLVDHGVDDGGGVRYLVTANAAWRADALRAVGGFDERFPVAAGEDVDMSHRLVGRGGRLGVTSRAVVLHDHRTTVADLLRTYRRHGTSRQLLARRHVELAIAPTVARVASRRHWAERYRRYREVGGARPGVTIVYLALRAAGSLSFALGLIAARVRGRAA
ncbi:MAG TPA: glycosyltransferase [Acidimicrobiales bacterium]|nr:glycosyltransferase [Acidimicrobiales bacterium]